MLHSSNLAPFVLVAAAEEEESGAQSPEPEAGPVPPPAAPGAWRPDHFACDNPRCGKLLCRPAVLNCGHSVCQPTCLGGSAAGSQQAAQQAASAAGAAAVGSPAAGQSTAASGGCSAPAAARYECPACGMAAGQPPAVCKQLSDLVVELFPAESRRREQEVEAQLAAAAAAAGSSSGGWQTAQQAAPIAEQLPAGMESGDPATPHASAAESEGAAAPVLSALEEPAPQHGGQQASGPAEEGAEQQQGPQQGQQAQQQQVLSPSLASALRRRQAEGGPASALAQRLEENLRQLASGDGYVHHGVGCDACGEESGTGGRGEAGSGQRSYTGVAGLFCWLEAGRRTVPDVSLHWSLPPTYASQACIPSAGGATGAWTAPRQWGSTYAGPAWTAACPTLWAGGAAPLHRTEWADFTELVL